MTAIADGPRAQTVPERATALELFFDLVYVFAFTQVTHLMADGRDGASIVGGLAVLGVLWWSWAPHAWLANQKVADRGAARVGIVAAIAIVLVLSISIPEVYPEEGGSLFGPLLFAIGFIALSLTYTAVNLVAAKSDLALRRQVLRTMTITIVPVSATLILGALLGGAAQLVLWLAAVVNEGVTVYWTSRDGQWRLRSSAHYAERHGLVVILALGESIISIGLGASQSHLSATVVIASLIAACIALGMWWVYFERAAVNAEHHIGTLTGHRQTKVATIGTYLHFGIVAGVLLASLGMVGAIESVGGGEKIGLFDWVAFGTGALLFLSSAGAYSYCTGPRRSPA